VLHEVANFCGFSFEPGMLELASRTRGITTASAVQVRDSVVVRDQPKYAPYVAHLQALIRGLETAHRSAS